VLLSGWVVDLTHTIMSFLVPSPSQLVVHAPLQAAISQAQTMVSEQREKEKQP
jgi:hypothetical protein